MITKVRENENCKRKKGKARESKIEDCTHCSKHQQKIQQKSVLL